MSLPINHAGRLTGNQHGWAIQRIHTTRVARHAATVTLFDFGLAG